MRGGNDILQRGGFGLAFYLMPHHHSERKELLAPSEVEREESQGLKNAEKN